MENLIIEETKYTPAISLDTNGIVALTGKSYPENTFDFYKPMMTWMEEYFEATSNELTTVNIEITYFNSSSSKLFFDFFDLLDENKDDHGILVNWIFDDENESAEEAGEDFIEDFEELTIKLVTK